MSKVISTTNEVMRAFNRMNEKGVVLFPGLDGVISLGRIIDDGRFIRCELDWDAETAEKAAEEFECLIDCLCEIGRWHLESDGELKWVGFNEDTFKEPETFSVWEKYFQGFPDTELFPNSAVKYFPMNDLGGYKFDLLAYMCFIFTRIYVNASSDERLMNLVRKYLATTFIINRYARKVELIDYNKPKSREKSIFPKRSRVTEEDKKLFGEYLVNKVLSAM